MQPVKVTAHLATPIAGHLPMLDGALTRLMVKHMPRVRASRHGDRHEALDNAGYRNVPIPIASEKVADYRIPLCSSPIVPVVNEATITHFARRAELDPALLRRDQRIKVNRSSGAHKSYYLPRRLWPVDCVVWFVVARYDGGGKQSGRNHSVSRLRQRLKKITAIGGKTSQGWGPVTGWDVERVEYDLSWYAEHGEGTVLMRPLPKWMHDLPSDLIGFRSWFDRPSPPYHDKHRATEVVVPC
jgi:hypothetical protein